MLGERSSLSFWIAQNGIFQTPSLTLCRQLSFTVMVFKCLPARRRGGDVAVLEVRVSNVAAIGLYESLGFESLGRRRAYYEDGEDALLFVKDLVPRKAASGARGYG